MTSQTPSHNVMYLDLAVDGEAKVPAHRGGFMVMDVRDGATLGRYQTGWYLAGGAPVDDVTLFVRIAGNDRDWTPMRRLDQLRLIGADGDEIEIFWKGVAGRRAVIATADPEKFELINGA